MKLPVKVLDIHKIEKKNYISISVFGYENNVKCSTYMSKILCEDKHVDLLWTGEEGKRYYVSSKILIH